MEIFKNKTFSTLFFIFLLVHTLAVGLALWINIYHPNGETPMVWGLPALTSMPLSFLYALVAQNMFEPWIKFFGWSGNFTWLPAIMIEIVGFLNWYFVLRICFWTVNTVRTKNTVRAKV